MYRWNEVAGRYIAPNGRFVSFEQIRLYLDATLDTSEQKVMALSRQLQAGQITVQEWQLGMRDTLKSIHLASSALAKGGWAQMSQADYGRVGFRLKEQYAYLQKFAKQIENGYLLDGRFLNRVQLYSQSGRLTYHMVQRSEMLIRGMTEEQNILGAADHCSECVSETARGWVPIGDLVLVGQRICMTNCRCSIEFR